VPAATPPPGPPQPKFRLFLLTFSLILVAVGALAAADLAGLTVAPGGYSALALAVIGIGLIIGAWYGRARSLILLGLVFVLALIVSNGVSRVGADGWHNWAGVSSSLWAPESLDQLAPSYDHEVGNATLDLTGIDFSTAAVRGSDVSVSVSTDLGNLTVLLPPNVDVVIDASVDVGGADVLGETWGGLNPGSRSFTDLGADGPGGGELRIDARVDVGNLEVVR
jgi:hypothetical protein